jgi:hypothetical protein
VRWKLSTAQVLGTTGCRATGRAGADRATASTAPHRGPANGPATRHRRHGLRVAHEMAAGGGTLPAPRAPTLRSPRSTAASGKATKAGTVPIMYVFNGTFEAPFRNVH